MNTKTLALVAGSFILCLPLTQSFAIPAFATDTKLGCNACHTAWPQLNATGRTYKELGYRFALTPKAVEKPEAFKAQFPISAVLKARPYDKKDSGDSKVRALHEVELMVGGPIGDKFSGFFEVEAEDEDTNARGFEVGIPHASFSYNHTPGLNVGLAWGSLHIFDPYESYSASRRLTRSTHSVLDQSFGGADNNGKLSTPRQNIALYGRPIKNLFYSVGVSGVADDSEGVNANTLHGRLMYEFTPNFALGLLSIKGTCKASASNCTVDRDFTRLGLDTQIDYQGVRVNAAWLDTEDRNAGNTADVQNKAWYTQAYYVFKKNSQPSFVPLLRFDQYEKSNGAQSYSELTLNLGYYVRKNVKAYIEYWDQTDVPTGVVKDNRTTLQIEVAF